MTPDRLEFRPIDNSSTTRLSYDLEANHWLRALNSAQASSTSVAGSFGFIGALISLLIIVVIWALSAIVYIFSGIWKYISNTNTEPTVDYTQKPHKSIYAEIPDEKYFNSWK